MEKKNTVIAMKELVSSEHWTGEFKRVLGENANTFATSLMEVMTNDTQLQNCDPKAVIKEAYKAASLKLPLNKQLGYAYMVVFNNSVKDAKGNYTKVPTPNLIIGYKGFIQLAIRSGQYRTINADAVYEGEFEGYNKLTGEIQLGGTRTSDKVVGYFAYFELNNGFNKTAYMSLEQMAKYALRYSLSFKGRNAPTYNELMKKAQEQIDNGVAGNGVGWAADFNSMACKTVLRNLLGKYGYLSIEMQNAYSDEVESENSYTQREEVMDEPKKIVDTTTGEIKDAEVVEEPKEEATEGPEYIKEQAKQVDSLFGE